MAFVRFNLPYLQDSTARLAWPLMDRRRTNQLLGLVRDIISTIVAMPKGHCIMGNDHLTTSFVQMQIR